MLNWPEISTVMLDMDGTLLDLNFDNHFWKEFVPLRYAELHGLSLSAAKAELEPRFKAMEGRLEWYCLDFWSAELELDIAGLKQEIAGLIAVHPHVTDFLDAARAAGKRLLLVTNAHRDSLNLKMEKTCLHTFFDAIVCSHDFGLAKEQAGFWPAMRAVHPFAPESSLLVDDSLPVLRSAAVFGLRHLVAVSCPDSRQPPRQAAEFPAIADFRQLLPGLG